MKDVREFNSPTMRRISVLLRMDFPPFKEDHNVIGQLVMYCPCHSITADYCDCIKSMADKIQQITDMDRFKEYKYEPSNDG